MVRCFDGSMVRWFDGSISRPSGWLCILLMHPPASQFLSQKSRPLRPTESERRASRLSQRQRRRPRVAPANRADRRSIAQCLQPPCLQSPRESCSSSRYAPRSHVHVPHAVPLMAPLFLAPTPHSACLWRPCVAVGGGGGRQARAPMRALTPAHPPQHTNGNLGTQ
jgi:hypothetical protein